mgnify:CR=1 FL=1
MPRTFYGPYDERNQNYANAGNANLGRWPLGTRLVLPDEREYKFVLNDGTVEIAGNLYQAVAAVADHTNRPVDVARAIDAVLLSATLTGTAAAVDIYAEGLAHGNDEVGEGYSYRIRRANTVGAAHASAVASGVLTVNLDANEMIQVALTTASEITFTRNRYHQVLITAAPPTGLVAGVSPGVAALDRYYWSQTKGYAAVLANLTLLAGKPVQADIAVAGAVESVKRRVRSGGTVTVVALTVGVAPLTDQDGTAVLQMLSQVTVTTGVNVDITGGIAINSPQVGLCVKANASTEFALIDLNIN